MQNVVDLFGEPIASEGVPHVDGVTESSRVGRAADGYDVAAETDKGLARIQVKARSYSAACGYGFKTLRRNGNNNKERRLDARDCDVLAFVAMDIQRVMFMPIGKCEGSMYVVRNEFMTPNIERITWTECLDSL